MLIGFKGVVTENQMEKKHGNQMEAVFFFWLGLIGNKGLTKQLPLSFLGLFETPYIVQGI